MMHFGQFCEAERVLRFSWCGLHKTRKCSANVERVATKMLAESLLDVGKLHGPGSED